MKIFEGKNGIIFQKVGSYNTMLNDKKIVCGIDEAGRGCIAGDLVVAGVIIKEQIEGINDSKKISEKKRELLYEKIIHKTHYHIVSIPSSKIDTNGLSNCMQEALKSIQKHLQADIYLFDGNTSFGVENLQTQVKADADVLEVGAASILAKVTHDRAIREAAPQYPLYGFEKHKGYGTKAHIEAIKKYGYTPYHRRSYKIKALSSNSHP